MEKGRNYYELTEREKAALMLSLLCPGRWTKPELYAMAAPGAYEDTLANASLASTASRWYSSKKAQAFLETEKAALNERLRLEREKIKAETAALIRAKSEGTATLEGGVDYSNPANMVRKLNAIVNASKDNGEILDAFKLLISKQAELSTPESTNPTTRQQRFFTPLQCASCPLYQEKSKKLNK